MGINEGTSARSIGYETQVVYLPVDKIAPNPYQPRRMFHRETIEELASSIREYGVMQPITVRVINGAFYELVAGERRLRASKMAGLTEIPSILVQISDKDSAIMALVENMQRENLSFFDEAWGLKGLIDDYCFTQEEIAAKIGKNQSTVANKIRILRLPREIQQRILENGLSERHARALLRLPVNDMELMDTVLQNIIKGELTVKAAEELIDGVMAAMSRKEHAEAFRETKVEAKQRVKSYFKDVKIFKNTIEQAVLMMNSSGMAAEYDIEERKDGCFISIIVSYT